MKRSEFIAELPKDTAVMVFNGRMILARSDRQPVVVRTADDVLKSTETTDTGE